MAIRQIISIPDPVLYKISRPVERLDEETQTLFDDMLETMYDAPGIGLAAVQIGVPLRVVVIDVSAAIKKDKNSGEEEREEDPPVPNPIFLINPEILKVSDERSIYQEGCLSIPDYLADVERPASCKVKCLDRNGKERIIDAEGILSTCLQHEIDHLNGVLFIDYISKLKRDMVIKKFSRAARQSGTEFGKPTID